MAVKEVCVKKRDGGLKSSVVSATTLNYPQSLWEISRLLRRLFYSDEGMAIVAPYGCFWGDGGCWSLAAGLKMWLEDVELYCVYDGEDDPHHVVVKLLSRPLFIDCNGIVSERKIVSDMKAYGVVGPISVKPFRWEYSVETPNGMELWEDASVKVLNLAQSALGDGRRFLWHILEICP